MKKHTLFIIFIIGIALAIGIWRENHVNSSGVSPSQAPLSAGTSLARGHKLPEFSLIDMNGKPFTRSDFDARWSFIFFGYSSCPDLCPTTLQAMQQISQRLRNNPMLQFVFITIDPENDTQERLKEYLAQDQFRGTAFVGVTGKKADINSLTQSIGVHMAQEKAPEADHIEHSGTIILINPQGELAAVFTGSDRPHAIAHDFKELLHRYATA